MSDIDPASITIAMVVDDLKNNMSKKLLPMIEEVAETLQRLRAHPAQAGAKDFEIIGEVMGHTQMIPMYDDGVEEQLTRPLTEKFGITGLANLAFSADGPHKQLLAYMICAARLVERQSDVKQVLAGPEFGINDPEELDERTEQIDHELRWTYNGDIKRFFSDLDSIAAGTLEDRIHALNEKNMREKFDHTSTLPEPKMMG